MTRIKFLAFLICSCLLFSLCGCKNELPYEKDEKLYGTHTAVMTVKDFGEVKIELYGDIAPVTVANFVRLIKDGFYNGLTFHRAIEGYMIQGGDPNGDGTGNSNPRIYGEFKSNHFENTLSHTRGVISMARSRDYNSASCQFFIMVGDETRLDGDYAAFGKVIEGMDVIDAALASIKTVGSNGEVAPKDQPVIEKIEMV
ncbi:MAG: peptidylprolyl isomerase [Clostridia bacterium]|nr:peptidylprolyl isomerase [Clostridia bacterium]